MKQDELMNLCYSCLIDGTEDHAPITLEDASYTLRRWQEEDADLAQDTADLTAEEFMNAWNQVFSIMRSPAVKENN